MHRIWTAVQKPLVSTITRVIASNKGDPRLYGKLRKFSTTLLLTPKSDSTTNKVKIHREAELIQLRAKSL